MPVPAVVPRLIAITDRATAGAEVTLERFERIARVAAPGTVLLKLRDPGSPAAERLAFGRALAGVARRHGQLFQVTDRLDLAVLLGADGVHLGETSVSVADARRVVGPESFVTVACHELSRLREIDADGVVLSPVVSARKGRPPLGLAALAKARATLAETAKKPLLFALGGVDASSARACLSAGADGVAVIGAVLSAPDPERIIDALGCARA